MASQSAETEDGGTAVAERPAADRRVEQDARPRRQPRYQVVLWDDDDHSYEYVVRMMRELFGHAVARGYAIAREVDTQGRSSVLTTTREHAELKRDQIHAYGRDAAISACAGSMRASIEPLRE